MEHGTYYFALTSTKERKIKDEIKKKMKRLVKDRTRAILVLIVFEFQTVHARTYGCVPISSRWEKKLFSDLDDSSNESNRAEQPPRYSFSVSEAHLYVSRTSRA